MAAADYSFPSDRGQTQDKDPLSVLSYQYIPGLYEEIPGSPEETATNDFNDGLSVVPSLVESIFSVVSLATSASTLSKSTGYSIRQIATATRDLVVILHEDVVLNPLCKQAIEKRTIGPERFSRNFKRLLKMYSSNLKEEANDSLDYLVARLVGRKAKYVADSILKMHQKRPGRPKAARSESRRDGDGFIVDELSTDDEEEKSVDEEVFENLEAVRGLLTRSKALITLRDQFRDFVTPIRSAAKHNVKHADNPEDATPARVLSKASMRISRGLNR